MIFLKEEEQQDQKTGTLTIFGCLKKKDPLDTLSGTNSSKTFKSTEPVATNTSKKDQTLLEDTKESLSEKEFQTSERECDVQASQSALIETDSAPFELPFKGHISKLRKAKVRVSSKL